jgi:hypothetical protein
MTDDFFSFEILSMILFVGVVVSTLIKRKTGINPGGIITAPFLAISFYFSFIWGLTILVCSYVLYHIYNKYFYHIYQGRKPMYITVLISMLLIYSIAWFYSYFHIIPQLDINNIYCLIVPAFIVSAIRKQGVEKTYIYTFISLTITALVSFAIYVVAARVFHYNFSYIEQIRRTSETLTLHHWFLLSLVSMVTSFIIYHFTKIKSGGYIVIPYIALLLFHPRNIVIFFVILFIIHLITKIVRHYTLLFGITRYVFVFCLSILVVWLTEVIGHRFDPTFSAFLGANTLPILALASITNDFSTQKARKTAPFLLINLAVVGLVFFFVK